MFVLNWRKVLIEQISGWEKLVGTLKSAIEVFAGVVWKDAEFNIPVLIDNGVVSSVVSCVLTGVVTDVVSGAVTDEVADELTGVVIGLVVGVVVGVVVDVVFM